MNSLAQINFGTLHGFGTLGLEGGGSGIDIFTGIISSAIGLMTVVAFIWFVFNFIMGAIGIMTAGGDKQKLENSRQKIVNGIIGVVVVILAVSVISFIGFLFKIPFLDLRTLFTQIQPGGAGTGGSNTLK